MTNQIDNALVIQFSNQVHLKAQQVKSRLRPYAQERMVSGQDYYYDDIGSLEAVEVVSRHQKTAGQDIVHGRRKIRMREFRATIYLDKKDKLETIMDPQAQYSAAVARALYRKADQILSEAAFADVSTGKDAATTVTFASDGGSTITATAGATYEKLLELAQSFIDDDIGVDFEEKLFLAITGDEHKSFMQETTLTSGDFTRQMAIEKGRMINAAGFDLIQFGANAATPILSVSGGVRSCISGSTRGLCLGVSQELSIEVDKRPDLNNLIQIQSSMMMGGVRTEGKLIKKFTTTD